MGKYKEDLGLALEMAGHADAITMHRFGNHSQSMQRVVDELVR